MVARVDRGNCGLECLARIVGVFLPASVSPHTTRPSPHAGSGRARSPRAYSGPRISACGGPCPTPGRRSRGTVGFRISAVDEIRMRPPPEGGRILRPRGGHTRIWSRRDCRNPLRLRARALRRTARPRQCLGLSGRGLAGQGARFDLRWRPEETTAATLAATVVKDGQVQCGSPPPSAARACPGSSGRRPAADAKARTPASEARMKSRTKPRNCGSAARTRTSAGARPLAARKAREHVGVAGDPDQRLLAESDGAFLFHSVTSRLR